MEQSCADLLFGSLSGNSYVREKSDEGYLEFHSMAAVTYTVKIICIGESKKRVESMLRLFSVFGRLFFSILSQKIS